MRQLRRRTGPKQAHTPSSDAGVAKASACNVAGRQGWPDDPGKWVARRSTEQTPTRDPEYGRRRRRLMGRFRSGLSRTVVEKLVQERGKSDEDTAAAALSISPFEHPRRHATRYGGRM